eukprot:4198397-Amphidinium_carterae.1
MPELARSGIQRVPGSKCHYFTSSAEMAETLKQEGNRGVNPAASKAAEVAHYSGELVAKLVQSLKVQIVSDGQMDASALHSSGPTADYAEPNPSAWEDVYDIQGTLLDPEK